MKNILITGSSGFIGRSLINRLAISNKYRVFVVDRNLSTIFPYTPNSIDYTIHLACVHRAENEASILKQNNQLNKKLITLLTTLNLKSHVIYTSSVKEVENSAYGESKRDGAIYLNNSCDAWGKSFEKIVLPNLFGPFARPFHTSVVANFCQNIVCNKKSTINNVELDLLYIENAVNAILKLKSKDKFITTKVFLPDLYQILEKMHIDIKLNKKLIINSKFEGQLFTTLMSYTND